MQALGGQVRTHSYFGRASPAVARKGAGKQVVLSLGLDALP